MAGCVIRVVMTIETGGNLLQLSRVVVCFSMALKMML